MKSPWSNFRRLTRLFSTRADERFRARQRIVSWLAKRSGTRIYDLYNNWFEDPQWLELWASSPWPADEVDVRKFMILNLIKLVQGLPGDTGECGAYTGCSSYAILSATAGAGRVHHIFDSFEGLSAPRAEDDVACDEVFKWKEHDLSASEARIRENLNKFDSVRYYKGWIPARFEEIADARFAFVHIDVDLYQPTLDSFRFFYPRMAKGGIILCDDYGFSSCPGAYRAMREFGASVGETVVHLPTGQGLMIKQQAAQLVEEPVFHAKETHGELQSA